MTKKDYNKAAEIVKTCRAEGTTGMITSSIIEAFILLFSNDNPRFDENKFQIACLLPVGDLPAYKAAEKFLESFAINDKPIGQ